MSNSSICPIDRILSGATTPGQNGFRGVGNEEVLCIPQSSSITGATTSDGFMSYPGHTFGVGSYSSAEMQLVYFTTPTNWAVV